MNHDELATLIARRSRRNETLIADHAPLREQLAADVAAYLARGGQIDRSACEPIRLQRQESTGRMIYAKTPAPLSDLARVKAVHERQRSTGQRIVLPGSHTGPKP